MNKISVVTISYNQVGYLSQSINSVRSQERGSYEHILVDPGSSDGSRDLIKKEASFRDDFKYIFESDDGPADGLNKGFSASSEEILYFLNADDLVCDGVFGFVVDYFKKHPDVDVLYGGGFIIDESNNHLKYIRPTNFSCLAYILDATTLLQQAFFFRKSIYEKVGGFNPENRVSWDGELFFKMKSIGAKFSAVYAPFGLFRVYPGTVTSSSGHAERRKKIRERLCSETYGFSLGNIIWLRQFWMLGKQISVLCIYIKTWLIYRKKLNKYGIDFPPILSVFGLWKK